MPEEKKKGNGFSDIAGMSELKQMVTEGFINVLKNRECAEAYGIRPPAMLLYGPAGCGKTFFAEKMAEEVGINFMKIVPDDLACTWVHGTQQKIGKLFREAEKNAPTLLFFDEFDAMVPRRSGEETNQHYDSEVNEFLCMLNNAAERGIYVLAATNHPERIDKAVLRTGRIDEMIYIDMPDAEARKSLFVLALSKLPTEGEIDTEIEKALGFEPKLKLLVFATTANKDAKIEGYIRKKDVENREKGLFAVDIASWEDIVDQLERYKTTYNWYVNNCQFKDTTDVFVSFDGEEEIKIHPEYLSIFLLPSDWS